MAISGTSEAAKRIVKVFGLDPKKTHSFELTVNPNEVITVKTELLVSENELEELSRIMRDYELIEKNK